MAKKDFVKFDWEIAKTFHQKSTIDFLLSVYNKPMTERDFVDAYFRLPRFPGKGHNHSPGRSRRQYFRLKNRYGFFRKIS